MRSVFISGILGGIILFIWGAVSWMVLPWHKDSLNGFKDEKSVAAVVGANVAKSGMYILPFQHMDSPEAAQQTQPAPLMMFASIKTESMKPVGSYMVTSIITQFLAAFLVAFLVSKTSGLGYLGRLSFIVLFALTAGIVVDVPYWNWFGFDTHFTLVAFGDLLISWFLAGLVMAKFAKK